MDRARIRAICAGTLRRRDARGLSVLEVLDAVDRANGAPIKRVMEGRRAGDPPKLVSANSRILETLDWVPQYADIDRIVGDALAWERTLKERRGA